MNNRRRRNHVLQKIPLLEDDHDDTCRGVTIVTAPTTPTIVVHSPSIDRLPFFDDEDAPPAKCEDPNTPANDEHADERLDVATPLPEQQQQQPETTAATRCANLRRNSISMPTGINEIELEMLRQQHVDHPANNIAEDRQSSDSASYSNGRDESMEEIDRMLKEEKAAKLSGRNGRRKSVMAALASRSPDEDSSTINSEDDSPVNSITSINSLASLLKEKIQSIPSKIKKKPTDYKIRAFVGFLFLCIVFFVGFAYIMYHQQVLGRAYFLRIKFNKVSRIIRVSNAHGIEVLRGHLGSSLGKAESYRCVVGGDASYRSYVCHEWLAGARLHLNETQDERGNLKCYNIRWEALMEGVHPVDCYDMSPTSDFHWYGGGQTSNMSWPLGKTSHDFAPFITGDTKQHQWGNALMRYFINSRGAGIFISDDTPLHVSIDHERICLKAKYDDFAFANRPRRHAELDYTVCTSANVKELHSLKTKISLWDGLKEDEVAKMRSLVSEPIWHIATDDIVESTIYNYTEDVIALGFLKQGHVLISERWQKHAGDLTLDTARFESLADIINVIHRRGFKIVFSVQPFVSTQSRNFAECVQKGLLAAQRNGDIRIPSLTRYKSSESAGLFDVTNNNTVSWLVEKLAALVKQYEIDALYVDFGTAHDMPYYSRCQSNLINPDEYKTIFTSRLEKKLNLIGVSSATSLPQPPIFLSMPPMESTWTAIGEVIPTILSYGVIGYPFLMPGAVGGDINGVEDDTSNATMESALPEKELYVRWLQLATFLPIVKFNHLPSKYNDEQVLEVAKILTTLRQTIVTPLLIKYLEQALNDGLPLIRPLWMLEPNDSACLVINDEFSVGEELIVAPILEKGSVQREVYLPSGVWKDGIDGSLRKGSRWLHDYKVPVDKVAYFVKLPDDTRF